MNGPAAPLRTLWPHPARPGVVCVLDQRALPYREVVEEIDSVAAMAAAIADMHVRGAPLLGGAAAWGMALAARAAAQAGGDFRAALARAAALLKATRPTAVNLAWAVDRQLEAARACPDAAAAAARLDEAARALCDEDVGICRAIGRHGLALLRALAARNPGRPVRILTHCNAGALACLAYGTATAPVYLAREEGLPVHVWVSETRPRNQGARLTAWELARAGVPHTLIADNAAGHLLQRGQVDLVLVGADRVTRRGDVANKIGTYLKALAARDTGVPFHVCVPSPTIDWSLADGLAGIPIEERAADEVRTLDGVTADGRLETVRLCPAETPAANPAFDVTPARLVTGLVTERGVCDASEAGLLRLFPERA